MRRVNCLAVSLFMVLIFALPGVLCGQRVVDLDKVWGDMRVLGDDENDISGYAVASGDINGDGYMDVIIGAPYASSPQQFIVGETYVIFGSSSPPSTVDLNSLEKEADIYVCGDFNQSGNSVASGDINNDGYDDIIIGAPYSGPDPLVRNQCGATYVIFGGSFQSPPYTIDLSSEAANITVYGDDKADHSGYAVASGDVNGDEYDDLIIGANGADPPGGESAGETYVIFGSSSTLSTYDLDIEHADITIYGDDYGDFSGWAVDSGDVNGDEYDDLIIGAWGADTPGGEDAGETYVIFGHSFPTPPYFIDLDTQSADITIYGDDIYNFSGYAVASGDVNGDEYDDLIIGAWGADTPGGADAGETYVIFGSSSPPYTIDLNTEPADITVYGDYYCDYSGRAVASGDVNGDGYNDIIIGAPSADPPGGDYAGKTFVIFCSSSPPSTIDLNAEPADITVYGDDEGDVSGSAVTSGDVNGDGCNDLIIGAWEADPPGGNRAGETYLVLGGGGLITVAHGEGGDSTVNVRDTVTGDLPFNYQVFGSANSNGEVHVARGDVDNDGEDEIICGHGYGGSSWVRGYEMNGDMIFNFKAFGDENVNGEVHVGAGDVDADGVDEIICGHGRGGSSWVKVFYYYEDSIFLANSFKAFGAANGQGEVHVAGGDVNDDGVDEIICGHGRGGSSWVKVFDLDGECIKSMKVFGDANTQGDVNVGAGNFDSTGDDEIICGHGFGGNSWVKVFKLDETLLKDMKVFGAANTNGEVHVAGGNIALDRQDEIICGQGYGGSSVVKVFEINGNLLCQIQVFGSENANGEVHVAACKWN